MGGTMRLGLYPAALAEGSVVREAYGAAGSRSGTGTATRSTTPTGTGWRRPGWSSPAPRRTAAGRVRRAAPRGPPLLRRHPGAPGAPVPADPAAPAVRRAGRGGDRPAAGAAGSRSTRHGLRRDDARTPSRRGPRRRPEGAPTGRAARRTVRRRWEVRDSRGRSGGAGRRSSVRRDLVVAPGPARSRSARLVRRAPGRRGRARRRRPTTGRWSSRQYRHPVGTRLVELPGRAARRAGGGPARGRPSASC